MIGLTAGVQEECALSSGSEHSGNILLRHSPEVLIKDRQQTRALIRQQTVNQLEHGNSLYHPRPNQDEAIQRVNHLKNKKAISQMLLLA